jgi:hypothetical protein
MKASIMIHPLSALKNNCILNGIYDLFEATKTFVVSSCVKISNGYDCATKLLHEKYQIENKKEAVGSAKVWVILQSIYMILVSVIKTIQLQYFSSTLFASKDDKENQGHHELTYCHQNKVYKVKT